MGVQDYLRITLLECLDQLFSPFVQCCILFLLLSLTSPSLLTDIPFWKFASRFNPHRVQARDGHVCVLQGAPEVGGCPRLSKDHSVGVSGSTFFHPLCSDASFIYCFFSHPLLFFWHPLLSIPKQKGMGNSQHSYEMAIPHPLFSCSAHIPGWEERDGE